MLDPEFNVISLVLVLRLEEEDNTGALPPHAAALVPTGEAFIVREVRVQ